MSATVIPRELTDSWQLTLEFWNEPARHTTLLGLAAKHKQLVWLAGKYKDAARSNPDDPIARERIERVRRATAVIFAMAAPPPPERTPKAYRSLPLLLLGAMIATAVGLVVTEQRVEQHHRAEQREVLERTQISRHP
jgi:hypothetical protein